jgi:membrane-associated phospholipid phosphatase
MITASERRTVRSGVLWAAFLLLALVGVGWLTNDVVDRDGLTAIDLPWHDWFVVHRTSALTSVMVVISFLGQTVVLAVLAAGAVEWLLIRRRYRHAVLVTVTTVGAAVLVPLLKHLVGRARPPAADRLAVETSLSYPSGHSLGSAAVLGALAVVVTARRLYRVLAVVAAGLLVMAIGVSRVYLGVHWPTDVLAGWLVGGIWLGFCLVLTSRWPRSGPAPADAVASAPVLDTRADQELRTRYLNGQISIGVYLDRRFGTNFGSAGDHRRAG